MFKLIKSSLPNIIKLQILVNVAVTLLIFPFLKMVYGISLKLSGFMYLNQSNFKGFLLKPSTIIALLFAMFIIAMVMFFELSAFNIIYIKGKQEEKISFRELIAITIDSMGSLMKKGNIFLFIYISLLVPIGGIIYKNPIIKQIEVPNFIMDSFLQEPMKLLMLLIAGIIITLICLLNIFTFLYMICEKESFLRAAKRSSRLFMRKKAKTVFKLIGCGIFGGIMMMVSFLIGYLMFKGAYSISNPMIFTVAAGTLLLINSVMKMIIGAVIKVFGIFTVAKIYFSEEAVPVYEKSDRKLFQIPKWIMVTATTVIVLSAFFVVIMVNFFEEASEMSVMAHRGSSVRELENTEEAFILSMEEGAKYIELDVVETKDNHVVVVHDHNMKRLAGVDKNIGDMTLEEVRELTVHNADKTKVGRIMTLDELLPKIWDDVVLNVEIKPQRGNDTRLALAVEEVLKNNKRHVVCSFSQESLKAIKEKNPERKTGLIMAIALGKYQDIDFVDFYSLEENFVTYKVVDAIHSANKKVFVWTVNDTDNVKKYLELQVDGILTDYPFEMKKKIFEDRMNYRQIMLEDMFQEKL